MVKISRSLRCMEPNRRILPSAGKGAGGRGVCMILFRRLKILLCMRVIISMRDDNRGRGLVLHSLVLAWRYWQ